MQTTSNAKIILAEKNIHAKSGRQLNDNNFNKTTNLTSLDKNEHHQTLFVFAVISIKFE